MFKFAAIVCLGLGLMSARAQVGGRASVPGDFRTAGGTGLHTSLSQQFVIRNADGMSHTPVPLGKDASVHYLRVDPALLPVSCERIKQAVLKEIEAPDNWLDKIYIELRHARTLNDEIIIECGRSGRNWNYHISLPDTVENTRLITTVVDVLLLEMANRHAERSAEIPTWLGEGLVQDLMRSSLLELTLEPAKPSQPGLSMGVMTFAGRRTNSLAGAHDDLRASPPLTMEQLSWPDEMQLEGQAGETFRSSAQLLVHELLQLRDGHSAMRTFIQNLPQHLNWQLTFLDAFKADFGTQLELEKWWALRVVDFTGRDIVQNWSPEESFAKLDAIIRPVVEVRAHANELPLRTRMTLQSIIKEWEAPRQVAFLKDKSKELYLLRSRVSQEMAKLTDDYRKTLDVYMTRRRQTGYLTTAHAQAVLGLDQVTRDALSDLDVLDSIREDLRPRPQTLESAAKRVDSNN